MEKVLKLRTTPGDPDASFEIDGACLIYRGEHDAEYAALFVAAPELLSACERLIGALGVMIQDKDSDPDIAFARSAISKAKGV